MTGDIFQLSPLSLFILFAAGIGIVYIARLFLQAQTVQNEATWAAVRAMLADVKDINNSWLEAYKAQGDKSSDSILMLSNNVAALDTKISDLTAAIDKSIEKGSSIQGASKLMMNILRNGGGRSGVKDETEL
jgi:hypothetical protein